MWSMPTMVCAFVAAVLVGPVGSDVGSGMASDGGG